MSGTRTYESWKSMGQRCTNPKDPKWKLYGGNGITVCWRWKLFDNFLADMGERPAGMTLDREDGKKGYEPDNCRWATVKQQNNNVSSNVRLTFEGKTLTLAQWAEVAGLKWHTLRFRLVNLKWPFERAITSPVKVL